MHSVELGVPFAHHRFTTRSGQRLAVQVTGDGPPVLLANGIGVVHAGMALVLRHLRPHYRVYCWDYRGMGDSAPGNPPADVSVQRQAEDGFAVLDHFDIPRAPVVGWSMGVPVGLEMIRQQRERITGFAALFGAAGVPFETGFAKPVTLTLHGFFRLLRNQPRIGQFGLDLAVLAPDLAYQLLATLSFVGRQVDRTAFSTQIRGVQRVPKATYFNTMLSLAHHDARDLLPHVTCPVTVVGGGRDWLTPPPAAHEMAEAIPGARLVMLPEATHFGVIEEPRAVATATLELLKST